MTRTYVHPDYNLVADFWQFGNFPVSSPPDVVGVNVQLYVSSVFGPMNQPQLRFSSTSIPAMYIGDIWEIPQGSGQFWKCVTWGVCHLGFPNEFWEEDVTYCDNTGNPKHFYP